MYNLDTKVVIDHNGKNAWYAPTEIKSICKIDISFFPFDEQKCPLRFGSWTYTGSHLNLTNKSPSSDLSKYTISGEWELIAVPAALNVVKYSCCPDPYIDVTYTVHVRRKVLFYLSNLILPCVVLAILTVFSFCLPPESGERVSLVITILLGLTVFMLVFTDNVPRTSEVIPLIVKYSFTVMCEVSFSLLITCFVVRVYHKDPSKQMPLWYRYVTYKILAPVLFMKQDLSPARMKTKMWNENQEKTKVTCPPYLYAYKFFSSLTKENTCKVEDSQTAGEIPDGFSGISRQSDGLKCSSLGKLEEISLKMCAIIDHLKDMRLSECNKNDWHFAARVLDTFFFWIFAVTIVVSTVFFYFMIPGP